MTEKRTGGPPRPPVKDNAAAKQAEVNASISGSAQTAPLPGRAAGVTTGHRNERKAVAR